MMQTDKEYAEALFMLAAEENKCDEFLTHLNVIKALIAENPDYIEFLSSPAIPLNERLQAIDEAFGASMPEYVVSFLKLLCENGRVRTLPGCIDEFAKLVMALSGKSLANIYSAVELSDEQKKAVCVKLEKLTGRSVDPFYIIDESLIGGLKIEIEGKTYDGSVRHHLREVKDVIIG